MGADCWIRNKRVLRWALQIALSCTYLTASSMDNKFFMSSSKLAAVREDVKAAYKCYENDMNEFQELGQARSTETNLSNPRYDS